MKKLVLLFTIFITLFLPTHVSADIGLSVSPPVTEILLSPNKSLTTTIQITNLGSATSYSLSLHRLIPEGNEGHSTIDPKPLNQNSIPLVVTLLNDAWDQPIEISSGQTKTITLKLEAPSLDSPQDLYLAILARPLSEDLQQSSTTTPGIAALLLTTITPLPAIPTDISLSPSKLSPLHDSSQEFSMTPNAKNNAEIMLRVKGTIKLTNSFNQTLKESTLEPTLILGKTSRDLTLFSYQPKISDLGPHTLTTTLTTEGGRTLIESSTVIWFFPIRAIILIFILTLLLTLMKIRSNRLTKPSKTA